MLVEAASERVVGALRLVANRPSDLAIGLELLWVHPAYAPGGTVAPRAAQLGIFATLDALIKRGYRRVEARVDAADARRRKLLESCGFGIEGVLRKYAVVEERSRDAAVYALLNTDWRQGGGKARLAAQLDVTKDS